jgi:hypothetical protein
MKDIFIQAYPELAANCQEMRKDGKTLTEIWRTMLKDKTMSPERALRILQAIFGLEDSDIAEIKSTAFDMNNYRLLASQGASNAELLGKIYSDTHRKSLTMQIFERLRKLNFPESYEAWNTVLKQHPELKHADLWDASDHALGIPEEITKNPFNQFFTVSADVIDRWHIVGFLIEPSRNYLTLRFLIFTDDTPFDIWAEKDLNALDWNIFGYIMLDSSHLAAFIEIARSYANRLNHAEGNDVSTFSVITEEEKAIYAISEDFYVQRSYPAIAGLPKTMLDVHYSGRGQTYIRAYQLKEGTQYNRNDSLGILHLSKKGLEDFCRLLETKMR